MFGETITTLDVMSAIVFLIIILAALSWILEDRENTNDWKNL